MNNGTYGPVDDLDITLNGNRLYSIADKAAPVSYDGAFAFKDNTVSGTGAEYRYDGNGNLVSDANKGIAKIEYDNMNQPRRIQFTNGNVTEYVYTSTGEKLRTIHRTAAGNTLPVDSTDYIGNFILRNGKADKYLFGGGYCTFTTAGQPVYHYYTRDHLGNNRAVVNENGTLEQVTHYYPFGGVYGDAGLNASLQPYKYNGKELDRTHELDLYDYGARNYDAIIGSWTTMDPLAERTPEVSPYVYCKDNPVNAIDPDGRKIYAIQIEAQRMILNTLPKDLRQYVQFDKKGYIRQNPLKTIQSDSQNFQSLKTMALSDKIVEVKLDDKFRYRNKEGILCVYPMHYSGVDRSFIGNNNGRDIGASTGETGLLGKTLFYIKKSFCEPL